MVHGFNCCLILDFRCKTIAKFRRKINPQGKVQTFVVGKIYNKLKYNRLKIYYYKLFPSNPVGNWVKMAYCYSQIIQFFDASG